jgi:hypothetical protein
MKIRFDSNGRVAYLGELSSIMDELSPDTFFDVPEDADLNGNFDLDLDGNLIYDKKVLDNTTSGENLMNSNIKEAPKKTFWQKIKFW